MQRHVGGMKRLELLIKQITYVTYIFFFTSLFSRTAKKCERHEKTLYWLRKLYTSLTYLPNQSNDAQSIGYRVFQKFVSFFHKTVSHLFAHFGSHILEQLLVFKNDIQATVLKVQTLTIDLQGLTDPPV